MGCSLGDRADETPMANRGAGCRLGIGLMRLRLLIAGQERAAGVELYGAASGHLVHVV